MMQIAGNLLPAEIAEKQARSIKYQVVIARLPPAKEPADFDFSGTPINEPLVRDHLAVAVARSCIRAGARGRFHTAVDLVNRLEAEARAGRQG
ncbi:MAG: ATPase, partial [Thermomicrobiales bacterium]|nr:ATPase [Thermomicrobiales bacterium]